MKTETRRATSWRLFAVGGVLLGILGPWSATRADVPDGKQFYVRADTWAETVLASRGRYARWWQGQLDGVKLGPWHTTQREDAPALEEPVDLAALDKNGNRQWRVRHDLPDGVVYYDLSNHGYSEQRRIPRAAEQDPAASRSPASGSTACTPPPTKTAACGSTTPTSSRRFSRATSASVHTTFEHGLIT